jgi:hypothetical protein
MTIVEIANKTNGRPIKFTPERIEQIKNLVERGKSREEIAEIINVTAGSLQVTCQRWLTNHASGWSSNTRASNE